MKSGILLLDKQPGMTSFDCIRALKRKLNRTDLGHGGTLDLFASGLLPVLVGEGLKLVRFFLEHYPSLPTYWKTYSGTFDFGRATDTGDPEGKVVEIRPIGDLSFEKVATAMSTFVNTRYDQMPPLYSAKKVAGERSSDLARKGKTPELKPTTVMIRRLVCTGIEGNLVHFDAECSKGTYVRALAEDLARTLGTVAHVAKLRRTAVGYFSVNDAISLDCVAEDSILNLSRATSFIPSYPLIGSELQQLSVGKVDGLTTRLLNSGLAKGVYCATSAGENHGENLPAALLELTSEDTAKFLRAFQL